MITDKEREALQRFAYHVSDSANIFDYVKVDVVIKYLKQAIREMEDEND